VLVPSSQPGSVALSRPRQTAKVGKRRIVISPRP
jgi:hypothetical protein